MIGIRADANKIIATGHIMRCMTIADALVGLNRKVIFFVADEESAAFVENRGFQYEVLNSDWQNLENETDTLAAKLLEYKIDTLLCDSYSVTVDYFKAIKEKTDNNVKIAYMDDLGKEVYPVDVLINYNAYAYTLNYEERYNESVNLLLGPMYAPLRPQFAKAVNVERYGQKAVMIASGGGDPYGICMKLAEEAARRPELDNVDFHIVAGGQNDSSKLERLVWCCHNLFLHKNVTEMAELMAGCDVAISAAGTMLTELCAMKVPAIEYVMADNQQQNSDFYSSQGIMIAGGDIRENIDDKVINMIDELVELLGDRVRLREMKTRLTGICDGRGADRIAKEIV